MAKLDGKGAVITGGSRGLGRVIAQAFLKEGAKVLICARNGAEAEATAASLNSLAPGCIFASACDIANRTDIETLARTAGAALGSVDILVANAAVQGPKGSFEANDWEKWIETIRINLIGNAYCCREFLPLLRQSSRGKILILSGGGATKPMPFFSAYAASKAAIVRFGETLAEEVREHGIDVNMIAPGALNTRMLDEVLEAGPQAVGDSYYQSAIRQRESGGASVDHAAALVVKLASPECDGITGRLISAPWDPWEHLEQLKAELAPSDIYTLRRIVPGDRGRTWDK